MTRFPFLVPRPAAFAIVVLALLVAGCASNDDSSTDAPASDATVHVEQRHAPQAEDTAEAPVDAPGEHHDDHDHPSALPADAPLPGASLYHLDAAWTDHRGEDLRLADLRGHPVIVTMIYASCETACPILVRDVARIFEALPSDARQAARVLVVSFDPERDAPERLATYVGEHDLAHPQWRFAVGRPHATRALAALLGVRYRPAGDGMFSHTNLIGVLGPDGRIVHSAEGLGLPVEPTVDAVVAALDERVAAVR
jgi:protein SCO1/2